MNRRTKITYTLLLTIFTACNVGDKGDIHNKETHVMQMPTETSKRGFEGIRFASKRDTICHMPVNNETAADTLVLDGKVYGFCSKECKEDFAKILKEQNKR
ncbi:MAG: YHS domain-containing protein [Chitinophagaceae bacterium]|nr:YHS domain-containing protein [Chitinophagaceae bacterium]